MPPARNRISLHRTSNSRTTGSLATASWSTNIHQMSSGLTLGSRPSCWKRITKPIRLLIICRRLRLTTTSVRRGDRAKLGASTASGLLFLRKLRCSIKNDREWLRFESRFGKLIPRSARAHGDSQRIKSTKPRIAALTISLILSARKVVCFSTWGRVRMKQFLKRISRSYGRSTTGCGSTVKRCMTRAIGQPWEKSPRAVSTGHISESKDKPFVAADLGFPHRNETLYVTRLKWATEEKITVKSLTKDSKLSPDSIASISLSGSDEKQTWARNDDGLTVELPLQASSESAYVLKIEKAAR